ncbi:MAG: hypothetical protein LBH05_03180 [Deferribacteraceae bacterium]|jgi:hypothetical protein|nr:hypothetical protein [Deferribacteraceae bacterium]
MSIFNQWDDIYENVAGLEGGSLLCVGVLLSEKVKSLPYKRHRQLKTVANAGNLTDKKYDYIFSESQLNGIYRLKDHFVKISAYLEEYGCYALAETTVRNNEDAWFNTLLTLLDPSHIRAPRAEEVIAAAAEQFELVHYVHFGFEKSYPLPEGKTLKKVEKHLKSPPDKFPDYNFLSSLYSADDIEAKTDEAISSGKLIFEMNGGFFVWRNL